MGVYLGVWEHARTAAKVTLATPEELGSSKL